MAAFSSKWISNSRARCNAYHGSIYLGTQHREFASIDQLWDNCSCRLTGFSCSAEWEWVGSGQSAVSINWSPRLCFWWLHRSFVGCPVGCIGVILSRTKPTDWRSDWVRQNNSTAETPTGGTRASAQHCCCRTRGFASPSPSVYTKTDQCVGNSDGGSELDSLCERPRPLSHRLHQSDQVRVVITLNSSCEGTSSRAIHANPFGKPVMLPAFGHSVSARSEQGGNQTKWQCTNPPRAAWASNSSGTRQRGSFCSRRLMKARSSRLNCS